MVPFPIIAILVFLIGSLGLPVVALVIFCVRYQDENIDFPRNLGLQGGWERQLR
jgi:hypothetical protein